MDKNMSITRTYDKDGYHCEMSLEVEQIENGFLVVKRTNRYPKEGSDIPRTYEDNHSIKKKFYKTNPLEAGPIWAKVKF